MTACCDKCGSPLRVTSRRGSLAVAGDPGIVFYLGVPFKLSKTQTAIVAKLIKHPFVTIAEMPGGAGSLKVQIHNLRKRLPADVTIKNIHGRGYSLEA